MTDCYFCMVRVAGISSTTLSKVEYPSIPSAVRHASHFSDHPVPIFQVLRIQTMKSAANVQLNKILTMMMLLQLAVAKILNQRHIIKMT